MKLHAVALLASALYLGGCAESVEEIPSTTDPSTTDTGGGADTSTGKDTGTTPPPDTFVEEDTYIDDTGSVEDSGEFPDFGGGEDAGDLDGGSTDGGSGGTCTTDADCPGACCDTTSGKCGVSFFGLCIAI